MYSVFLLKNYLLKSPRQQHHSLVVVLYVLYIHVLYVLDKTKSIDSTSF